MGNENQSFIPELSDQEGPQPGPSWANPNWLSEVADSGADLVQALDPTQMKLAVQQAAKTAGKPVDDVIGVCASCAVFVQLRPSKASKA